MKNVALKQSPCGDPVFVEKGWMKLFPHLTEYSIPSCITFIICNSSLFTICFRSSIRVFL